MGKGEMKKDKGLRQEVPSAGRTRGKKSGTRDVRNAETV